MKSINSPVIPRTHIRTGSAGVGSALLEGAGDLRGGPASVVVAEASLDAVDDLHDLRGDFGVIAEVAGADGALVEGLGDAVGGPVALMVAQARLDRGLDLADNRRVACEHTYMLIITTYRRDFPSLPLATAKTPRRTTRPFMMTCPTYN